MRSSAARALSRWSFHLFGTYGRRRVWSNSGGHRTRVAYSLYVKSLEDRARISRQRGSYSQSKHQSTEQRLRDWNDHPLTALIGVLRLVLIEWTTGYGLYPFRAMGILISMIALFAIAYVIPLSSWSSGAIYGIFPEKSVQDAGLLDTREVQRLHPDGLAIVGYALWFSLLTAFHFGWRELNVGTWLSRLQTRDYILQPTRWVRLIAGVQSILSIYLVAIWALTYFGRPFG